MTNINVQISVKYWINKLHVFESNKSRIYSHKVNVSVKLQVSVQLHVSGK